MGAPESEWLENSMNPSRRENLKRLLNPGSIVFVGGRGLDLPIETARTARFKGSIWVVNPKYDKIGGLETYPSLADLPETPDAAFLAVRADLTVEIVRELNAMGCAGVVCFAAGFSEVGRDEQQQQLIDAAGDMALLGPNCYGLLNYVDDAALWADAHGGEHVEKGVAIISQSGNLGLLINMADRGLSVSHVISIGNQAVIDAGDCVELLVDDERVSAIGLYVEGIPDISKFSRAAQRALDRAVPIVALKGGVSEIGQQMTMSHTGSRAGSDEAHQKMFEQLGIARVDSMTELLETLKLFSISGPFAGRRLGVLTCSGADSTLMADFAATLGVQLPPLSREQQSDLREYMAEFVNLTNPLDYNTQVWGQRELEVRCFTGMMRDDHFDAVALVHDFPAPDRSDLSAWVGVANSLVEAHLQIGKPTVLISHFGERIPPAVRDHLCNHGVTPLCGLQEGIAAIRHAGLYGERRAKILEAKA
jgi:acyl-CoA synthetase (NDP forming)